MNLKQRLNKLETAKQAKEPHVIIVDWGGDTLTINGQELSREEAERLYPKADRTTIIVEYKETPYPTETVKWNGETVKQLRDVSMKDL